MRSDIDRQIDELEYRLQEIKGRIVELRRRRPPEAVDDYVFRGPGGEEARLSDLFAGRDRLILIHNMGKSCPFCTLWADGFVGLVPHLTSRAAFVVTSPDDPEEQQAFAASRGWTFPIYSTRGTSFVDDMGFLHPAEGLMPGVSVFVRDEVGGIGRVGRAEFGPGDDFCAVWHFFDLLPEGVDGWEPRFAYEGRPASCGAAPCGCH